MSYVEIQAGLEKRLELLANLPPMHTENTPFDPTVGVLYIEPLFLPAEPTPAALGTDAANRVFGFYQVNIYAPSKEGRGAAYELADRITKQFYRGLILAEGNSEIKIVRSWAEVPAKNPDWFVLPVTIRWQSDQPNT